MPTVKFTSLGTQEQHRIIEAIIDDFLSSGYRHNLTLGGVAAILKMPAAELQTYFVDEEDLLEGAAHWVSDFWMQKFQEEILKPIPDDLPTEKILAEMLRRALEYGQEFPRYLKFDQKMFYEMDLEHPLRKKYGARVFRALLQKMQELLQRGQRLGDVRLDLHPRIAAYWIEMQIYFMTDASLSSVLDEDLGIQGAEGCEVANASLDLLIRGIEPVPTLNHNHLS